MWRRCCRCGCCWPRATHPLTFLKSGRLLGLGGRHFDYAPDADHACADQICRWHWPWYGTGNLFPFPFITIACGAVSGFHVRSLPAPRRRCWRTKGRRALSATVGC
ncbi:carbon starvation CstA family protein [Escherichia coli]